MKINQIKILLSSKVTFMYNLDANKIYEPYKLVTFPKKKVTTKFECYIEMTEIFLDFMSPKLSTYEVFLKFHS